MIWPTTAEWPELKKLNAGQKYNKDSPVTNELFNKIVYALIYLKERST